RGLGVRHPGQRRRARGELAPGGVDEHDLARREGLLILARRGVGRVRAQRHVRRPQRVPVGHLDATAVPVVEPVDLLQPREARPDVPHLRPALGVDPVRAVRLSRPPPLHGVRPPRDRAQRRERARQHDEPPPVRAPPAAGHASHPPGTSAGPTTSTTVPAAGASTRPRSISAIARGRSRPASWCPVSTRSTRSPPSARPGTSTTTVPASGTSGSTYRLRIRFPARCDASWSRPAASRSSSVSMLASRVEADTARSTATQTPPVVSVSYPSSSVVPVRTSSTRTRNGPAVTTSPTSPRVVVGVSVGHHVSTRATAAPTTTARTSSTTVAARSARRGRGAEAPSGSGCTTAVVAAAGSVTSPP